MPQDLAPKTAKLKRGDIRVRTRADLTATLWRDKRDICVLTNIHDVPAEGNFCNEAGKTIKPQTVMDYNRHMGYVDKGDRRQTVIPSAVAHSSGRKKCSSTC
jgi:hypothetical protein